MSVALIASFPGLTRPIPPGNGERTYASGIEKPKDDQSGTGVPTDKVETRFDLSKMPYLTRESQTDEETGVKENPELARYSREKSMAQETLQRLVEEYKIVKKVWANQPEEMAKQLIRLAKELAKVMKAFQKAQAAMAKILGAQSGMNMPAISLPNTMGASLSSENANAGDSGDQAEHAADAAQSAENDANAAGALADDGKVEDTGLEPHQPPDADLTRVAKAYARADTERVRLDQTPYANELRGDIEFASKARSLASKFRETFEEEHKKAMNLPGHSEEREKFLKKVGKALEEFETDLMKYEGALKSAMPPAIYADIPKLSFVGPASVPAAAP